MGLSDAAGAGPVAVDTALFIYLIEEHPLYLAPVRRLFENAERGTIEIVTSALTLLEVLVIPLRQHDDPMAARYEALMTRSRGVRILDLSRDVLKIAAGLRAQHATPRCARQTPSRWRRRSAPDAPASSRTTASCRRLRRSICSSSRISSDGADNTLPVVYRSGLASCRQNSEPRSAEVHRNVPRRRSTLGSVAFTLLTSAGITAGITACTTAEKPAAYNDTTDSAGVAIVRGPAVDDSLPWTFTKVRQIGGADTGTTSFDRATAYNVATDGRAFMAVLDAQNDNRVHLFDSTGTLVRSVGGRGGGPGELEFPQGIELERTGTISVVDAAKSAIVTWNSLGVPQTQRRLERGYGRVWGMVRLRGDTVYAAVDVTGTPDAVRRIERWTPADTMRIDSTVGPKPKMTMFKCVGLALPPLFTGEATFTVGDSAMALTHQSAYVVDIVRNGRRVRSIRRAIPPVNATVADASKLYPEGLKVSFGGDGKCVTPASEVGEKLGVAPALPMVRDLRFAPDGSLWVERYTFQGETPRTDVFDPNGHYLGTLTGRSLPLGFLGNDVVLFSIADEDTGASAIGVFRIRR